MKGKKIKLLIYLLSIGLLSIVIMITPLDNYLIYSFSYLLMSIYIIFNICGNTLQKKHLLIYSLYILTFTIFNVMWFSKINILISLIIILMIIHKFGKKTNTKKMEESNEEETALEKKDITINVKLPVDFDIEEFEHIAKKLYIDMQTYFMNLEYLNLERILSKNLYQQFSTQMHLLEKNNKCAVRDNIEFFDFKLNDFMETNNNQLIIKTSIGVIEDKYTRVYNSDIKKSNCRYESYYEVVYTKKEDWSIDSLKLIYSHSKRKKS